MCARFILSFIRETYLLLELWARIIQRNIKVVKVHFIVNICMTKNEIDALVKYLTFSLETFCDEMIQHTTITGEEIIYDKAYTILQDIENTLNNQHEMTLIATKKTG